MSTKQLNTEREWRRAGERIYAETRKKLQDHLEKFIEDCNGKDEYEIKKLYSFYEEEWKMFALKNNTGRSVFTIYGDSFEAACLNGYKTISKVDPKQVPFDINEAKRIFHFLRKKSWIQNVADKFKRNKFKEQAAKPFEVVK